jgi:hypothetical protein
MIARSKTSLGDHVTGASFESCLSKCAIAASGQTPRPRDASRFGALVKATLLYLALVAAFACAAQPALARVVVKKGAYGAIALQRETGQFGYAYNSVTSRAAKIEALNQCGHPRCEVVANFRNACGALARGPKKYFPATGATRQEAETKALHKCAANECTVIAWACTK